MHSKAKIAQSTTLHHKVKKIMVRSYKKGKKYRKQSETVESVLKKTKWSIVGMICKIGFQLRVKEREREEVMDD